MPRSVVLWRLTGGLLGLYTALVGAFLLPVAPLPFLPVGLLLTLPANYALAVVFRRLGQGTPGAAMPAVAWLATTLYLGLGRPEGDVVLLVAWPTFLLLVLGAGAAAFGIARPPELPPRATGEPGSRETAERR